MKLKKVKKFICLLAILAMSISISACGLRNDPEPVLDGAKSSSEENPADPESSATAEHTDPGENETIAVADFYYMQMPNKVLGDPFTQYAINDVYLYYTNSVYEGSEIGTLTHIVRQRVSDGYSEKDYIISEKPLNEVRVQILLADGEGCCYLLWSRGRTIDDILWRQHNGTIEDNLVAEEDVTYFLEKYGPDGELLWHVDYTPDQFQLTGRSLSRGIVTADGRIFLYTYGIDDMIFAFSSQGQLEETYVPNLASLDGVAAGKDGRVYAYCITGDKPIFLELGADDRSYVSPRRPQQVYSGNQYGLYLQDRKGMWRYEPDTEEMELLWGWDDEYVQMNSSYVDSIYQGDRGCMLLSLEEETYYFNRHYPGQTLTLTMISSADSRDYPGKQPVSLAVKYKDDQISKMVNLYNRHSKKYNVETVIEGNEWTLESKLLRGEGPDLININDYYAENLAEMGAFEDLAPYYESSETVAEEDLLEPIRRACTIHGKKAGVVPSFWLETLMAKDTWHTREEWDVWALLEMAVENRLFRDQDPYRILQYCMGLRYGEYFIDWEKKECHFDSEEFRRCLEECRRCATYVDDGSDNYVDSFGDRQGEDGWLFVEGKEIRTVWDIISEPLDFISEGDPEYCAKMVGLPGWSGGEYDLNVTGMFAINSASEQKEGAWDFLEYLLSEEYQVLVKSAFPVRKDNLELHLKDLYDSGANIFSDQTGEPSDYGSTEENIALMREMVDAAVYNDWHGKINPVRNIIDEEAGMYFAGDATLDETVDKIQNRMQLYLNEH